MHDNRVSVIDSSWGNLLSSYTINTVRAYEQLFKPGAAQGQAFFFASGDAGDKSVRIGHVDHDYPASDPWVTSVGGTTLNIDADGHRVWEAGWGYDTWALRNGQWVNDGFGPTWQRPAYQQGVVHSLTSGRAYPDIAADADNLTGVRVGYVQHFPTGNQYAETRWGGTSVASPLMVGEQAAAQEALGGRVGFANPLIYALARTGSNAFHDVTAAHDAAALVRPDFVNGYNGQNGVAHTIRTVDDDTSLRTAPGWDDVTGVGTPTANYPAALAGAAR